jgi:hypothetical protein
MTHCDIAGVALAALNRAWQPTPPVCTRCCRCSGLKGVRSPLRLSILGMAGI